MWGRSGCDMSPHWSPGLIRLIWLARRVSPSSLTAPCASLPKLRARSKRTTIPDRGGPVLGQGYTSSCAPLLEPPHKLSRPIHGIFQAEYWSGLPFSSLGIFLNQGSNPGLPHCSQTLYHPSHQESSWVCKCSIYWTSHDHLQEKKLYVRSCLCCPLLV